MAFEVESSNAYCHMCGTAYSKRKGNFPVSYAVLHRGLGYLPICKSCAERLYDGYLEQCNDPKYALRQLCRKLDLYWDEHVYDYVSTKATTRSLVVQYLQRITNTKFAGKSYDTTLEKEGTLWKFDDEIVVNPEEEVEEESAEETEEVIPKKYIKYWGEGYKANVYKDLEQRKANWMSSFPDQSAIDVSTEAIIKQLCYLEVEMNAARAKGRSVDKLLNSYNTLLGSANLKPVQRKQEEDELGLEKTPLGVWLYRYENKRPLPEVDDDCKDVNGLRRYVFTWMGHLCKMLGLKNAYEQLYQDEIDRLRVEKPEYDGDDDEAFFMDVMTEGDREDMSIDQLLEGDTDESV